MPDSPATSEPSLPAELRRGAIAPLPRAFVRAARRHPGRFFMADATLQVSFGAALLRAVFLARRLRKLWHGQEHVGILLPPCVGGALVNLAAALMGRTAVNLNYTASAEAMMSAARQCRLQSLITSRLVVEKLNLQLPITTHFVEDLAAKPGVIERLAAVLLCCLPYRLLEQRLASRNIGLDDIATVIFSSGSTGEPKGVMLSHYNVAANARQLALTFKLTGDDRIAGILPFFHSFGYTVTIWLPATHGCGAVYHRSPLEAKTVGELVRQYVVTLLVSTPTFLQGFMRQCAPEDFACLKYVIVGAEKLPERIRTAFEEKFHHHPLEGYGCTECAPVVAVNTLDRGGNKPGTIGKPIPGISVRIVHPETRQPLPPNQPGLLLVRGPNVMAGYLGHPEQTSAVLRDGWYETGDIASLDEDGFLTISGRLSRFSKIAGEMVPHGKIEETLQELAGTAEPAFVVTSVPDESKGERLVVLHTLPDSELQSCLTKLGEATLPPLWKPRPQQFFRVQALPYLGSGKLDVRLMREVAARLSRGAGGV